MSGDNPFEIYYRIPVYLEFKDSLYNFLRRREEVRRFLGPGTGGILLEIGSGVSPITEAGPQVIYTDVTEAAMKFLRETDTDGKLMTMSVTDAAMRDNSVSTIVCSEVLEHIRDDNRALGEMHRILKPGGALILTVPIHPYFYSYDDRFVKHERRYAVKDLVRGLKRLGFVDFKLSKVTALLDKIAMLVAVVLFQLVTGPRSARPPAGGMRPRAGTAPDAPGMPGASSAVNTVLRSRKRRGGQVFFLKAVLPIYRTLNCIYAKLVKWEAKLMPLALTTVLLVHCRKRDTR